MQGDVSDDLDDQPRCERGGGVVEFRWKALDASFSGVFDDAGSSRLTQAAEGLVDQVVVDSPLRDGLGFDVRPGVGIARGLAGEEVVEGAAQRRRAE